MRVFGTRFPVPNLPALPNEHDSGFEKAVEEYATHLWDFYNSRAKWHRRLFRSSGIIVILTGAALPLLAAPDYPGKQLVISLAGALVAVLTALRAFYRWDGTWILLRKTEMAVTSAHWRWRDQLNQGDRQVATSEFIATLMELRQGEADSFFKELSFPAAGARSPRK